MTRDDWLMLGLEKGWVEFRCLMHDGILDLLSDDDLERFEAGDDPCMFGWVAMKNPVTRVDDGTEVR